MNSIMRKLPMSTAQAKVLRTACRWRDRRCGSRVPGGGPGGRIRWRGQRWHPRCNRGSLPDVMGMAQGGWRTPAQSVWKHWLPEKLAGGEQIMKFPGIDEKTFAICVCCLAVVAASSDRRIWSLLCVGAIVVAIARFVDARRKRIQREHTSN